MPLNPTQVAKLESDLRNSPDEWQYLVYQEIKRIECGHVITYGGLASRVNKRHGLNIISRNTAWLRDKLYDLIDQNSGIPLHRIAKKGDSKSKYDSPKTQEVNRRLRTEEGSWPEPEWLYE
jgi:alkylated DNA nucleotide flippase Atl1